MEEKHKRAISESLKGHQVTEATKRKIGLANRGVWITFKCNYCDKKMKNLSQNIIKVKHTSAIENVKRSLLRSYLLMSKIPIKVSDKLDNRSGYILQDIGKATLNGLLTLRLGGTLDNAMQKGNTHLRNGKNSNEDSAINVLFAELKSLLPKTTLYPYRMVAQITSRIFNLCAVVATAKSGEITLDYFNIMENPELLGG